MGEIRDIPFVLTTVTLTTEFSYYVVNGHTKGRYNFLFDMFTIKSVQKCAYYFAVPFCMSTCNNC
jgi:hypothetical protein